MKIKFAMTILASCVLLTACSSDDDDDKKDNTVYTLKTDKAPLLFNDYENVEVQTFDITSNDSWAISIADNDWLTVDQTEGKGNATITVTAQPNTTLASDRNTLLTVTGVNNESNILKIAVNQASDNTVYTLTTDVTSLSFENFVDVANSTFNITSNDSWTISIADNDWLTIDQIEGKGDATATLTAQPNTTELTKDVTLTITGVKNSQNVATIVISQKSQEKSILNNISDPQFKRFITEVLFPGKTIVTEADAATITTIDISGWADQITSVAGIENFTELKRFNCSGVPIGVLDVSKNTNLQELHCNNTSITSLDLSNNKLITILSCANNNLGSLDTDALTALKTLSCNNNKITSLDIDSNINLEYFNCADNKITYLEITKNTKLYALNCNNNAISNGGVLIEYFIFEGITQILPAKSSLIYDID